MRTSFKTLTAAALLLGGAAAIQPSPASAQADPLGSPVAAPTIAYAGYYRGGRYYPRIHARSFYGGYRGYAYRRAYFGPRRYYGGYRPAYYGYRRYGYYPYRPYYYHRGYGGGAVAAGFLGGLALGALANPYYHGYYAPGACVVERRRVVNHYGHHVWRRVEICR
jgi:hypothetical protein